MTASVLKESMMSKGAVAKVIVELAAFNVWMYSLLSLCGYPSGLKVVDKLNIRVNMTILSPNTVEFLIDYFNDISTCS